MLDQSFQNLVEAAVEMHTETIKCPKCERVQTAQVTRRAEDPFPVYLHECEQCGYVIMESEWEEVFDA